MQYDQKSNDFLMQSGVNSPAVVSRAGRLFFASSCNSAHCSLAPVPAAALARELVKEVAASEYVPRDHLPTTTIVYRLKSTVL
jgi:hypothetical protein